MNVIKSRRLHLGFMFISPNDGSSLKQCPMLLTRNCMGEQMEMHLREIAGRNTQTGGTSRLDISHMAYGARETFSCSRRYSAGRALFIFAIKPGKYGLTATKGSRSVIKCNK